MNQKTLAIIVIAVVIVAAIGAAAYFVMSGGENEGDNGDNDVMVSDASSLQYSVDLSFDGESMGIYTYSAKNIGTNDMMIRVEFSVDGEDFIYIVNGANQEAWGYFTEEWLDLSATFSDEWDLWSSTFEGYTDNLSDWTTGDWTYNDTDGSLVKVYDITIDPVLNDALFEPEA
jgi:hypothetical protein